MDVNEREYQHFYDRVGAWNGWDFSKVKCKSEGAAWELFHEVAKRCTKSDLLLDIGTGGGETLLSVADAVLLAVGIDNSEGMMKVAHANAEASGKTNVRMMLMDTADIRFPDSFFNVASCRHAPFHAQEVARVLAKDGLFLTQQVSEEDKLNLKQAFRRGQSFGTPDGTLKHRYITELREAGFTEIQSFEYDSQEYYETFEDLLFVLKHTPIIPGFGEEEQDYLLLDHFIAKNTTSKGIMTNSKRFAIIARK